MGDKTSTVKTKAMKTKTIPSVIPSVLPTVEEPATDSADSNKISTNVKPSDKSIGKTSDSVKSTDASVKPTQIVSDNKCLEDMTLQGQVFSFCMSNILGGESNYACTEVRDIHFLTFLEGYTPCVTEFN